MYGYVVVNQQELKIREYAEYRSYYCGLCQTLKDSYGRIGQFTISYDMTFLVLLLTGLYEPEIDYSEERCIAHPFVKHPVRRSKICDYVADMNILMTYYKCVDDWQDEKKVSGKVFSSSLKSRVASIEKKYPKKSEKIKLHLKNLRELELKEEKLIDAPAREFGGIMAEICDYRNDEWQQRLRSLGDYLGRFIYILDAYEDLEKDIKTGSYNVLKYHMKEADFDDLCEEILKGLMARGARDFEYLPIISNVEILKNIIYSGVWTRFDLVRHKRNKNVEGKESE
ncbi:MAG: DUF5685 family protein [Lachnospira sp.]